MTRRAIAWALAAALLGCGPAGEIPTGGEAVAWEEYGGDPGGRRFSPLADIGPANVGRLRVAWIHHTGDLPGAHPDMPATLANEVTPILVDGTLYLCTAFNRVLALDPETGEERWSHDPEIDLTSHYANQLVCRGVAAWLDPGREDGAECRRRIFSATNDARLLALDAATGRPCPDFGTAGEVDLNPGVGRQEWRGEYQVTSPPLVGRDVVVVGSAVSDNARTDAPSGVVRAYDTRSGALRWAWDLAPPGFERTPENTTPAGYALATPNVWAPMSVDRERDLVFVPTGNPSPDYFRGERRIDHYGSSVVALRGASGEVVWRFQTVHHDLWDLDLPAQPTLFDLERDGHRIPALVQPTKMGFLFVLHRETGEPLFPVEERPVPQGPAAGEWLSPTQPFPVKPPPLTRLSLTPDEAWGITPWDRRSCRERLEALRFDGPYTPPSTRGSLMIPSNSGGVNWGGVAVDEARGRLVVNIQDIPWYVQLVPRAEAEADGYTDEFAPMRGTPYGMRRGIVMSPLGVPCSPPPWGSLLAVDLREGEVAWEVPLGTLRDALPVPLPPITLGVPNLGGPLLTASGLVFIGAAFDKYFRAFDAATGEELWRARIPAGGQATPMTYRARPGGRQFVVIAATGYGRAGAGGVGDSIVAFALE